MSLYPCPLSVPDGHWKLVANFDCPWELYDYYADRTELVAKNQATANPDIVHTLSAQWMAWAKRVGVAEVIPGFGRFGQQLKTTDAESEEAPDN